MMVCRVEGGTRESRRGGGGEGCRGGASRKINEGEQLG